MRSALKTVAALVAVGVLLALFSTETLGLYGLGVFCALPFALGYRAARAEGAAGAGRAFAATLLTLALIAATLLAVAAEGLICLVMAAPLALLCALTGLAAGLAVRRFTPRRTPLGGAAALAVVPLAMISELAVSPPPEVRKTATVVEIAASPEIVWRHVASFSELSPPTETIFLLGVAHPLRAEIDGTGVGAVRRCVFSTGAFVEPITAWEAPRRLAFDVAENPPPMRELSPYPSLRAPHLEGYFVSERGEFRLDALPGGRTRLTGTTWYRHDIRPAVYWTLWSDSIVHAIHRRVLDHVRTLAEADAAG